MTTISIKQLDATLKGGYATLKVAFCKDIDDFFIRKTRMAIHLHNKNILSSTHPDSGFDLRVPNSETFNVPFKTHFVNLGLKSSMSYKGHDCGFLMYPRSSISKTPLMLANHTGIIDSGYRGPLIAAIRYLPSGEEPTSYKIDRDTRIVQICHPSLCPIFVIECEESELTETNRGDGGFGSTGK
jgi:dUTP pyrophosphatase